jgi:hypothetical protein
MRNQLITIAAVALATVVSTQAFAQDITPDQRPFGEGLVTVGDRAASNFSHQVQSNYGGDADQLANASDQRPFGEGLARSGVASGNGRYIDITPDHRALGQ